MSTKKEQRDLKKIAGEPDIDPAKMSPAYRKFRARFRAWLVAQMDQQLNENEAALVQAAALKWPIQVWIKVIPPDEFLEAVQDAAAQDVAEEHVAGLSPSERLELAAKNRGPTLELVGGHGKGTRDGGQAEGEPDVRAGGAAEDPDGAGEPQAAGPALAGSDPEG